MLLSLNQDQGIPEDKLPSRTNDFPFKIDDLEGVTLTGESFRKALQKVAFSLFVV